MKWDNGWLGGWRLCSVTDGQGVCAAMRVHVPVFAFCPVGFLFTQRAHLWGGGEGRASESEVLIVSLVAL